MKHIPIEGTLGITEENVANINTLGKIVGLVILLVISKIFFPKLFIPIIVIAVILEILNNILPGKKE